MQQVHMGKALKNDMWISQEETPDPNVLPESGVMLVIMFVMVNMLDKNYIIKPQD